MPRLVIGFLVFLALLIPARAQECSSKVQELLSHSDIKTRTMAPCRAWAVTEFESIPRGDGLTGLLLIGSKDDVVVVGVVVRRKDRLHLTPELQLKLLQFDNELDYVKVGIDHDGDLFVRQDLRLSTITAEQLKNAVTAVADASVTVYAELEK
jgi:hypothetical protein